MERKITEVQDMSFFYIDESKNFELKLDRNAILHIPEIRELVENKKFGYNFLYYAFLFCARSPFGRKPEEVRDQLITEIVTAFPYNVTDPRNVAGFYKHKKFKDIKAKITELYPDTLYDAYQSSLNMIDKLRIKRDNVDLDDVENMLLIESYNKQIEVLVKQVKMLETDMIKSLNNKTITFGAGSLVKDL